MASGDPNALEPCKRAPKTEPLGIENAALKKRNQKLEKDFKPANIVIDVQKTLRPARTTNGDRAGGEMNLMQDVDELIPHFEIKASCSQLNVPRASYNWWRVGRNPVPAAR